MKIKLSFIGIFFSVISIGIAFVIIATYKNEPGYGLLPLMPLTFGIMSFVSSNMIKRNIPENYGATLILSLLMIKSVILPLFFQMGNYVTEFRASLVNTMQSAILISVYEIIAVFLTLIALDARNYRYLKKITKKESTVYYNFRVMKFWVIALLIVFILTFIIEPNCKYFYLSIYNLTDLNFTNNEMSTIIDNYSNGFISKLIMVLHNYLTKIVRFLVPLHFIVLIHRNNVNYSGFIGCIFVSLINLIIIDGTIARGFMYAFVLLLLTCIVYGREKDFYKIAIAAIAALGLYFYIRAVFAVGISEAMWSYLSRYIGSYFSSVANTAATLNMNLKWEETLRFIVYDYLESVPFGNTLFGLESISFQKFFNSTNLSYGQIPTTIGTSCIYFGYILAPIYSIAFTIIGYKAGVVAKYSNSVFKKGIFILLAMHCAMAITMYYIKIVLVVIIGTIIPMIIINRLIEKKALNRGEWYEELTQSR